MSQKTETELLRERIKSLEEHLGVKFVPAEGKDGYAEHVTDSWGFMHRVEKLFTWASKLAVGSEGIKPFDKHD